MRKGRNQQTDLHGASVINEGRADHSSPSSQVDAGTKAFLRKTCQQMRSFCNLSGAEGAGPSRGPMREWASLRGPSPAIRCGLEEQEESNRNRGKSPSCQGSCRHLAKISSPGLGIGLGSLLGLGLPNSTSLFLAPRPTPPIYSAGSLD